MKQARKVRPKPTESEPKKPRGWSMPGVDFWICMGLVVAVLAVYGQVRTHSFVTYDDPIYVTENQQVRNGLSWDGVAWAFTTFHDGNWFPLTWISHMADVQFFGLDSGWHHLTNVWIHALSTLLLFGVLKRMTGARWQSAVVALLFGVHPLHVESVVWIAERKDVLSAFFWMLALWCYAGYAARPGRGPYVLALLMFCLGLMAKPMLVTLPVVLMLLDYWPLHRGFRLLEKLPFFAASIAASIVTIVAHQKGGAIASVEVVPLAVRCENAVITYAVYILQTFWPTNLAVFYPYSLKPLLVPAIFAGISLTVVTLLIVRERSRRPYLAVGWFWYGVTLLPVIGLIQTGAQARADRYTYIPMIGLTIAIVWGVSEVLQPWPKVKVALAAAAGVACLTLTWFQVQVWHDDISLYQHAIEVVPDNYIARFNLASTFESQGRQTEAIAQLRQTIQTRQGYVPAHAELGQLLAKQGQTDEAMHELQTAITMRPDDADAHFRLGSVLGTLGRPDDSAAEFAQTLRLQPDNADAHFNLGLALGQAGKLPEAVREFDATIRLRPEDANARFNLGIALAKLGRLDEAIVQFSDAVRLKPDSLEARQALDQAMTMRQKPDQK